MTQLEVLQARKMNADEMGPDVIRAHQALYDEICDEIYRLQLSENLEDELAAVVIDATQQVLPADCEKYFPGAAHERNRLEQLITQASNHGHPEEFRWYLPLYRRSWLALSNLANERLELERTMDQEGFRSDYGPTPFDSKQM